MMLAFDGFACLFGTVAVKIEFPLRFCGTGQGGDGSGQIGKHKILSRQAKVRKLTVRSLLLSRSRAASINDAEAILVTRGKK